jgi:DNA-binding NarL/FixJ family response regulator
MTNTIHHGLARPTVRRLRVQLREPIRVLSQAICLALAAFGLDLAEDVTVDGDDRADVVVWALDSQTANAADPRLTAGPPVLALVEGLTPEAVRRLYGIGVRAVLERGTDAGVVAATALAVGNGLVVAHPALFDLVPETAEPLLLDRNELRWMRSLASGRLMSAIAHDEGHSERDMYRKFKGIYAKLGVNGRAEALVLLARADLLGERRI